MQHIDRDPLRPVDWRWRLASAEPWVSDSSDDDWVKRARAFHQSLDGAGEHQSTESCDHAIHIAYSIWTAPSKWMRFELEARLLTDECFDSIAQRLRISSESVVAYERVFFAVKESLSATSYVFHMAIGVPLPNESYEQAIGRLWKLYAYFAGGMVLDAVISGCRPHDRPITKEDLFEFFRTGASLTMAMKAAIATRLLPVTEANSEEVLELYLRYQQLGQEVPVAVTSIRDIDVGWQIDPLGDIDLRVDENRTGCGDLVSNLCDADDPLESQCVDRQSA